MIFVKDLLRIKGNDVWFVAPQDTMIDALRVMADRRVGALLVMEAGEIRGIVSERDFARKIAEGGECIVEATVESFMTHKVITIGPRETIDKVMEMMTNSHIRHLPVVDEDKLVGLISIGDVVREMLESQKSMIDSLENYIQGSGYGH